MKWYLRDPGGKRINEILQKKTKKEKKRKKERKKRKPIGKCKMSHNIEKERVNKGVGLFLQLSGQKFDRITALERCRQRIANRSFLLIVYWQWPYNYTVMQ